MTDPTHEPPAHAPRPMPEQTRADGIAPGSVSSSILADAGEPSHPPDEPPPPPPWLPGQFTETRPPLDDVGLINGAVGMFGGQHVGELAGLDPTLRHEWEPLLGVSLDAVKVDTSSTSAEAAEAMSARAFTVGQDIHGSAAQLDPSSEAGRRLLAHEVAHTVQQRGAGTDVQAKPLDVSRPGDAHEQSADKVAEELIAGRPAAHHVGPPLPVSIARSPKFDFNNPFESFRNHPLSQNPHIRAEMNKPKLGDVKARASAQAAIDHLNRPAKPGDTPANRRAPLLSPPAPKAETQELISYAKQSVTFENEWAQILKAAETAVYGQEQRGLNPDELAFLQQETHKRFLSLENYFKHRAATIAIQHAATELARHKRALENDNETYGPWRDPSLAGELAAPYVKAFKGFLAGLKALADRSQQIQRDAMVRGDYSAASFAPLSALAITSIESVWQLPAKMENTISLLLGDDSIENEKAAAEVLLLGMSLLVHNAMPLRRGGSGGTIHRAAAPALAGAGATAATHSTVAAVATAASFPLSHAAIVGSLLYRSRDPNKIEDGHVVPGRKQKSPRVAVPNSYMNRKYDIDMKAAPDGSTLTSLGHKRNGPWFWRQLRGSHRYLFSKKNLKRIAAGRSPRVDKHWLKYYPQHASFKRAKLVHHHVDQGPMATPVPEPIHQKWDKQLHPHQGDR